MPVVGTMPHDTYTYALSFSRRDSDKTLPMAVPLSQMYPARNYL